MPGVTHWAGAAGPSVPLTHGGSSAYSSPRPKVAGVTVTRTGKHIPWLRQGRHPPTASAPSVLLTSAGCNFHARHGSFSRGCAQRRRTGHTALRTAAAWAPVGAASLGVQLPLLRWVWTCHLFSCPPAPGVTAVPCTYTAKSLRSSLFFCPPSGSLSPHLLSDSRVVSGSSVFLSWTPTDEEHVPLRRSVCPFSWLLFLPSFWLEGGCSDLCGRATH